MQSNNKELRPPFGKILGFDHVTFWVGNAKQAAAYYTSKFGLEYYAYKGLETGERSIAQHVIKNQNTIFVFCSAYGPKESQQFNHHLILHGDGVKDIAFKVEDTKAIYQFSIAKGAVSIYPPKQLKDEHGTVILASIQTYGDTTHTFVQRDGYKGVFMPGFKAHTLRQCLNSVIQPPRLELIDHIVGNQPSLQMEPIVSYYQKVLRFHRFWSVDDSIMHTEYSALRSIVVTDYDENIKMPINEPAPGKRKSQIQQYIDYYHDAGVQHIALRTEDIISTVQNLRSRGVQFLGIPDTYYDRLKKNLSMMSIEVVQDIDRLQKNKILLDYDEKGYLLQIFTRPLQDRPTLFFEVIQRRNHQGFGVGNFKSLFISIEEEQAKRGNL